MKVLVVAIFLNSFQSGICNMNFRFALTLIVIALLGTGCSQRWIESDTGYAPEELMAEIASLTENVQGLEVGSAELQKFISLKNSPKSSIYFVDGPSPMGQALSAASLLNFGILDRPDKVDFDLQKAIVIYVEDITENGYESALFFQVTFQGEETPVTKVFVSLEEPIIDEGKYIALMGQGGNHDLTLESYYTQDGDLQSVIQFQVYQVVNGVESWVGKLGAMVGFGG